MANSVPATTKRSKLKNRSRRVALIGSGSSGSAAAAQVATLASAINAASRPTEAAVSSLSVTAGSSAEMSSRVGASQFHRQALSHSDCYLGGASGVGSCLSSQISLGELPVRLDLDQAVGEIHFGTMRPQTAYSSY